MKREKVLELWMALLSLRSRIDYPEESESQAGLLSIIDFTAAGPIVSAARGAGLVAQRLHHGREINVLGFSRLVTINAPNGPYQ